MSHSSHRIAFIGAGSGFATEVALGFCRSERFRNATLVLMDISEERLAQSERRIRNSIASLPNELAITATTGRREALEGADYVVTACEKKRAPYWIRDIQIPRKHGVSQWLGENGGPGGQAHAMRNITLFMDIARDMRELCPRAWMINFTNPMSFICTYMMKYSGIRTAGMCHQVHGSFGVVSEMLGFEPGELQVITGGINHLNWLMDIRRKSTGESFMAEFTRRIAESPYWNTVMPNVPENCFSREIFETFGAYPVGYDSHIAEYMPWFYTDEEMKALGYPDHVAELEAFIRQAGEIQGAHHHLQIVEMNTKRHPFPRDPLHPHYRESAGPVMEALASNQPAYFDSMVTLNHGAIANLPDDAVVDVPAVCAGGEIRSIHVGTLPDGCAEICRRQIAIHELLVPAVMEGDRKRALQSLCLDPYIRSLRQAGRILDEFLAEYRVELPQFWA